MKHVENIKDELSEQPDALIEVFYIRIFTPHFVTKRCSII